jgi:hypothetical protein
LKTTLPLPPHEQNDQAIKAYLTEEYHKRPNLSIICVLPVAVGRDGVAVCIRGDLSARVGRLVGRGGVQQP